MGQGYGSVGIIAACAIGGALAALFVASCAGATHVVPTGPNTYMVASRGTMGWSSGGAQKAKAFEEADAYCKASGKVFQVIRTNETAGGFGQIASGEVEFRCLNPDDPALRQPAFGPTPTQRR
jgi:hypothetical protein